MVGHPEVHGKVPCAGCGKTLWLSLDEQGEAQVELYEEHLHEAVHQERVAAHKAKMVAQAATADAGGGGSSLIVSVIAAAVVAVVVSLVMGGSKAGDGGGAGHNDARIDQMAKDLEDLRGVAATAGADVSEVGRKLGELEKRLNERLAALSKAAQGDPAALKAIRDTGAALTEAVEAVKAAYKALHGRIEGNYTRLNAVDKRLKKLEAP